MNSGRTLASNIVATGSLPPQLGEKRPGFVALVFLATWCGLVAGLLEVGMIVIRKQTYDPIHFYRMSHHFVWLIPVTEVCVFLAAALVGYALLLVLPGRGRWLAARLMCALTLLPTVLVALPRIYFSARLILALGAAAVLVRFLERHGRGFQRFVRITFPALVATLAVLAASPWVGDWIKQSRESSRPLPPPGSPNIVLIVLDTVAAGHLSLYGYERDTTPNLVKLAERAIRFDSAQAAAPWTLPSHATMFTGRWTHELSFGWSTPLDDTWPTLAEYLGTRGYATAGFVANNNLCARDSGLARGFTVYQDFSFPGLTAFTMSALVGRAMSAIQQVAGFVEAHGFGRAHLDLETQLERLTSDRRRAGVVSHELVDWLSAGLKRSGHFLRS